MDDGRSAEISGVYIDGASVGNPGPSGIGVVFVDARERPLAKLCKYVGETTNNVAEYLALLYALQAAQQRGLKNLVVKTDSELLTKQLAGQYKVRDATLRILYDLALHTIKGFESFQITHIDRSRNTLADQLAGEAIEGRFDTSLKTVS